MDDYSAIVVEKLNEYSDIQEVEVTQIGVDFVINNKKMTIICNEGFMSAYTMPFVIAQNENDFYPHYLSLKDNLHFLCLSEHDSLVEYLLSFEEKIHFLITQIIRLCNLSPSEIEEEYKKEFYYYWSKFISNRDKKIEMFFNSSDKIERLKLIKDIDQNHRIASQDKIFNDADKYKIDCGMPVFYIPIIDNRGVLPPIQKNWNESDILNIIDNSEIQKISLEDDNTLRALSFSGDKLIFVFDMYVESLKKKISFACKLYFKNKGTTKLLDKIKNNIKEVEHLSTVRCDFKYLNDQIGNNQDLIDKNVAVIGAGSLGSYISRELIQAGVKNLTIIDKDTYEADNLMRHTLNFAYANDCYNKAILLKFELEKKHPEVMINAIEEELNSKNALKLLDDNVDFVIFTIGDSDTQLMCNRIFSSNSFEKPVLYCWLEGNAITGHVLAINYSRCGCFECLFTDGNGTKQNNKSTITTESELDNNTIRNGCGGTRIAYGNKILLDTTSMLIMVLREISTNEMSQNILYTLYDGEISIGSDFIERSCACCNETQETAL